jgi:hypothetical protein
VPEVGTYFFFAGGMVPSLGAAYVRICEVKMRFEWERRRGLARVRDMVPDVCWKLNGTRGDVRYVV